MFLFFFRNISRPNYVRTMTRFTNPHFTYLLYSDSLNLGHSYSIVIGVFFCLLCLSAWSFAYL